MGKVGRVGFFVTWLLLIACQPQAVIVEVTRLVAETEIVVTEVAVTREVPLEVTRAIEMEVTRLVTEEQLVEVTKTPLGTAVRPIQLLFAPVVDTAIISEQAALLADHLQAATGYHFAVGIADDTETLVELMCLAPQDTIGFLTAVSFILAEQNCNAQLGLVAQHADGQTWQADMLITRPDTTGLRAFDGIENGSWAMVDPNSLQTRYFEALFAANGVVIDEKVAAPSDNSSVLAVYENEVEMATATFTSPILPFDEARWDYAEDSPEIWRRIGTAPYRSGFGYILVNGTPEAGGYRIRDARAGVFDERRDVFDVTRVLTTTAPIPNETIAFGADFPLAASRTISTALTEFVGSEACAASICSTNFYGWMGLETAVSADYEPIHFIVDHLDLTLTELLQESLAASP